MSFRNSDIWYIYSLTPDPSPQTQSTQTAKDKGKHFFLEKEARDHVGSGILCQLQACKIILHLSCWASRMSQCIGLKGCRVRQPQWWGRKSFRTLVRHPPLNEATWDYCPFSTFLFPRLSVLISKMRNDKVVVVALHKMLQRLTKATQVNDIARYLYCYIMQVRAG